MEQGENGNADQKPRFDLEITITSGLIGISNIFIENDAIKGICSLLSPPVAHYSIIWVRKIALRRKIEKDQEKFELKLEGMITKLENELSTTTDEERKKEINERLVKARNMLHDSQMDMLEFDRPDLTKKE